MSAHPTPLAGRRVLLTRSAEDCADWAERLTRVGAVPVILPCIESAPIDTPTLRAIVASAAGNTDWWVFTSRRGVEAFAALHRGAHTESAPRVAPVPKIAVVGESTAAAARAVFGRVDLVGGGTAERLAETLVPRAAGTRVLLALAENAGDVLERALSKQCALCTRVDVYRTVPLAPRGPRRALSALGADAIVLASPSAVTGLLAQVSIDSDAAIVTIGPATTAAAGAQGLKVTAEAKRPGFEGVLEAIQWLT